MHNNINVSKILADIDNLANTTYQLLDNTFDKMGITDTTKSYERLAICNNCEYYKSSSKKCEECGCYMPLKSKLTNAKCPLNFW